MPIQGILFDFNGTLFFDSTFHLEAFRRTMKAFGMPVPDDNTIVSTFFGRTNERICRENVCRDADAEMIRAFSDCKESHYRAFCRENTAEFHFTPGAVELLEYLKEQQIPYCLATGSGIDNVQFYLDEMDLGRYFPLDRIVYDDGSIEGKPSPQMYELAAARIGLSPKDCAVFEDGTSGILAANRAHAGAVIAVYEEGIPAPFNEETKVDAVYHDLRNWKEILAKLNLLR